MVVDPQYRYSSEAESRPDGKNKKSFGVLVYITIFQLFKGFILNLLVTREEDSGEIVIDRCNVKLIAKSKVQIGTGLLWRSRIIIDQYHGSLSQIYKKF